MIDKSSEYWHLYFDESCAPNPTAIRETVQKLFDEAAEMGDVWFMRAKPIIEIIDDFEGDPIARVYCRFSAKPCITMQGTSAIAIGLTGIQSTPMPTNLCPTCREWYADQHVCLNKTYADLKRELLMANTLVELEKTETRRLRAELDVVCNWARSMAERLAFVSDV